jgi:hypothetical protein
VPDALRAADAKCLLVPEAQHKADSGISSGDGVGKAAQAAGVGGADRQQLQLALYVVLGALALTQLGGRPAFVLLQLLLLAALAALTLAGADRGSEQEAAQDAAHGTFAGAWAAASAGSWAAREGVSCCGWSLRLVASDVCSSPSRHLQLQVRPRAGRDTALCMLLARLGLVWCAMHLPRLPATDDARTRTLPTHPRLLPALRGR